MFYINKFLNKIYFTVLATFCLACLSLECVQNPAKLITQLKNHVSRELKSDCKPEHLVILEAFNELEKTLSTYATRKKRIEKFGCASMGLGVTSFLILTLIDILDEKKVIISPIPEPYLTNLTITSGIPFFGGFIALMFSDIVSDSRDNMILKQLKIINNLLINECDAVASSRGQDKISEFLEKYRLDIESFHNNQIRFGISYNIRILRTLVYVYSQLILPTDNLSNTEILGILQDMR